MPANTSPGNERHTLIQLPLDTHEFFPDMPKKYKLGSEGPFEDVPNIQLAREALECFAALRIALPFSIEEQEEGEEGGSADEETDQEPAEEHEKSQKPRLVLHSDEANALHRKDRATVIQSMSDRIARGSHDLATAEYDGEDTSAIIADEHHYPSPATQRAGIIWAEVFTRIERDIARLSETDELPDLSEDMLFMFIRVAGNHYGGIDAMMHFIRSIPLQAMPDKKIDDCIPLYLAHAIGSDEKENVKAALKVAISLDQPLSVDDLEHCASVIDLPNGHLLYHINERLDQLDPESSEEDRTVILPRLADLFQSSLARGARKGTLEAHMALLPRFESMSEEPSKFVPAVLSLIHNIQGPFYRTEDSLDHLRTLVDFTIEHGDTEQIGEAIKKVFAEVDRTIDRRDRERNRETYALLDAFLSELQCMSEEYNAARQLAACGQVAAFISERNYGQYLTTTDARIDTLLPRIAETNGFEEYKRYPTLARRILLQKKDAATPVERYVEVFPPESGSVLVIAVNDKTFPERLMQHEDKLPRKAEWRIAAVRAWLGYESVEMESPERVFDDRLTLSDLQILYSEGRAGLPGRAEFFEQLTDRANHALLQYARDAYEDTKHERRLAPTAMLLMEQLAWDGRLGNVILMKHLYIYLDENGYMNTLKELKPVAWQALVELLGITVEDEEEGEEAEAEEDPEVSETTN